MSLSTLAHLIMLLLWAVNTEGCPSACYCHGPMADCYNRNLGEIPADIPPTAVYVNLEKNQINTIIPERLTQMLKVANLFLKNNKIASIPSGSFLNMTNLQNLDLSMNIISQVESDAFQNLPKIFVLKLDNNQLSSIDGYLGGLPSLERLEINSNMLTTISDDTFSALNSLTYLSLSRNQISSISKNAFGKMTKLSNLVLSMNPLANVDGVWNGLSTLSSLDLSSCQLNKFPTGMPNNLEYLRLSNNSLTIVGTNDLKQSRYLGTIYLDNNKITTVEDNAFGHSPYLSQITLNGNKLRMLPIPIPTNVTSFDADDNEIERLFQFNFDHDSKMIFLSLKNNSIEALAANTFSRMSSLESLYLDNNKIQVLYQMTYSQLTQLRMLSLASNPVREIEMEAFHSLTRLVSLKLSGIMGMVKGVTGALFKDAPSLTNLDLQSSPHLAFSILSNTKVLGDLRLINYLNLMNNNLTNLDGNLGTWLPRLKTIRLTENPWQCDNKLIPLRRWMAKSQRKFTLISKVLCQSPDDLKGMPILKVDIGRFTAPPTTSTRITTLASTMSEQSMITKARDTTEIPSASTHDMTSSTTKVNPTSAASSTKKIIDQTSSSAPPMTKGIKPDMKSTTTASTPPSTTRRNNRRETTQYKTPSSQTTLTLITTRVKINTAKPSTVSIIPFFPHTGITSSKKVTKLVTASTSSPRRKTTQLRVESTTLDRSTSKRNSETSSTLVSGTSTTATYRSKTSTQNAASNTDVRHTTKQNRFSTSKAISTSYQTEVQTATSPKGSSTKKETSTNRISSIKPSVSRQSSIYISPGASNQPIATAKSDKSRLAAITSSSTNNKSKAIIIGVSTGLLCLFLAVLVVIVYIVYRKRQKRVPVDNGHYEDSSDTANIINRMHSSDLQSGTLYTTDTDKNSDVLDRNGGKSRSDSQCSANGHNNKKTPRLNKSGRFGIACLSPNSQDDSEMLVYSWDQHNH